MRHGRKRHHGPEAPVSRTHSRDCGARPERYGRDYWERIPGVYYTGDAAHIDEDGYVWFGGRADEIIKIAGHRIGTIEVESACLKHPAVAECGVVGRPDELRGEVISAFVLLKHGHTPSAELRKALIDTVRRELGPVAVIGEMNFIGMLPKTRSGKIMRRVLKAVILDRDPGDITTIEDEGSVEEARQAWLEMKSAVGTRQSNQRSEGPMFKAFKVFSEDGKISGRVVEQSLDDLSEGAVVIKAAFSSVNYKDALAATGAGKIMRRFPLIGGIDVAGTVESSEDARFKAGDPVLVTGYDLGVAHDGGFSGYVRVPAEWVVPIPQGLTPFDTMAIGTAGFTAALSIVEMERNGLAPANGPVIVTGATGGVGSIAIQALAARGYAVTALTGKAQEADYLRTLGATDVIVRGSLDMGTKPLEKSLWAGAVDPVGGDVLGWLTRTMMYGGCIANSGLTGGIELKTTVLPFILRGVKLLGIDSVMCPDQTRREVWRRLASDLKPCASRRRDAHAAVRASFPMRLRRCSADRRAGDSSSTCRTHRTIAADSKGGGDMGRPSMRWMAFWCGLFVSIVPSQRGQRATSARRTATVRRHFPRGPLSTARRCVSAMAAAGGRRALCRDRRQAHAPRCRRAGADLPPLSRQRSIRSSGAASPARRPIRKARSGWRRSSRAPVCPT